MDENMTDGQMDRWTNRGMTQAMLLFMEKHQFLPMGRAQGRSDQRTDGRTDGRADGWTDARTDGRTNEDWQMDPPDRATQFYELVCPILIFAFKGCS